MTHAIGGRAMSLILGTAATALLGTVLLTPILAGIEQRGAKPSPPIVIPASGEATPTEVGTAPAIVTPNSSPTRAPVHAHQRQLRAVSFLDDRTGWVLGTTADGTGVVLGTKDGGHSWETLASLDVFPAGSMNNELRFVDARHGWLITSVLLSGNISGCAPPSTAPLQCRTVILRTSDGGRTWREQLSVDQPSKLGAGIRALSAVDDGHAWAIRLVERASPPCTPFNCNLEVVATTDGEHWSAVSMLPSFSDQLAFVDTRTGWATTYTAKNEPGQPTNTASVLVTHDGGRTWKEQLRIDGNGLLQVDFIDAHNGWALASGAGACGGGTDCTAYSLYRTTDGGRSWTTLQDGAPPTGWWSPRNNVSTLGQPRFASASLGWIPITYDGRATDGVLRTTDGGQTWTRVEPTDEVFALFDVAASRGFAWVVGERIGDEVWFVARLDAGTAWTYELTVSR